jgi:hypothetical protein
MVLMIFQPPIAVPTPMVVAHSRMTHHGTANFGRIPPSTRARVNTPMNFWPSLLPWLKAMSAAEAT